MHKKAVEKMFGAASVCVMQSSGRDILRRLHPGSDSREGERAGLMHELEGFAIRERKVNEARTRPVSSGLDRVLTRNFRSSKSVL